MAVTKEIVDYLDDRLRIREFEDVSMNGLQVQGAPLVNRVAVATDAAMATYRRAAQQECEMLVTHHGLIWGGLKYVTGRNYAHLKFLMDHDINLYAAHLPLDAHPELGNNAILSKQVGLLGMEPFGSYHGAMLGYRGNLPSPLTPDDLAGIWKEHLGCDPTILSFGKKKIESVGIVSGRGGALTEAIERGVDCLVTGEGSHENHHEALEAGINIIFLGHYYSEIVGVRAVGLEIEEKFGVEAVFIDEPTGF
jgi:dinuclear metal center YbgI/SA1388 family protein